MSIIPNVLKFGDFIAYLFFKMYSQKFDLTVSEASTSNEKLIQSIAQSQLPISDFQTLRGLR